MEVLKLKESKEYQYLEGLKGKALENWNWQVKEDMNEKRSAHGSAEKRSIGSADKRSA